MFFFILLALSGFNIVIVIPPSRELNDVQIGLRGKADNYYTNRHSKLFTLNILVVDYQAEFKNLTGQPVTTGGTNKREQKPNPV